VGFYYAHPQNIFWRTLALVLEEKEPEPNTASRKAFLLKNRIAVFDVLRSCEIDGASDSSIQNPAPNQFRPIIESSEIAAVFTTGKKATQLFEKFAATEAGLPANYLPSTSPANRARHGSAEFMEYWTTIKPWLK
jgi:hypoxanthine-DNA glycosylase